MNLKKICVMVAMFIFMVTTATTAAAGDLVPRLMGDDVIVPDMVIQAIPDKEEYDNPVYAACDLNGWLQNLDEIPDKILEKTKMVKTEEGWTARDMEGQVFHPTQIQDGKPVPAKLENVYIHIKEFDFIVWRGDEQPSILVEE